MSPCGCDATVDELGYCDDCGILVDPPESVAPAGVGDPSGPAPGDGAPGGGARTPDPRSRLLTDPVLPERRRRCRNADCRKPVGQSTSRRSGLVTGFCTECGWGYSARPPLQPDPETGARVTVGERYEVLGTIGRGGLGWIYLAWDTVVERYVVLKGLLDPDDPVKRSIALAELKALAAAQHPNIVTVHDFVGHRHALPRPGGRMHVDYIVMEYVHGESLLERFRRRSYFSVKEAAECVLPAMEAVADLHERNLVHNDFKPDNIMVTDSGRVILVDLGAVSHPRSSGRYGTAGYWDPRERGGSRQSDIYAIGRSLAALTMKVPGFAEDAPLPDPGDEPLLATHESFHALLERATHGDPAERFATVDEFAVQLRGVVREVEAVESGPQPGTSELFGPELRVVGAAEFPQRPTARLAWALSLPEPLTDPADLQARRLVALRAGAGPRDLVATARELDEPTRETALLVIRARIELMGEEAGPDEPRLLDGELDAAESARPGDPRVLWLRGVLALARDDVPGADDCFAEVMRRVPGEAAPKLGRAMCAELSDDPGRGERWYRTVWRTDRGHVGAAFGLARALMAREDPANAITVLGQVPGSSRYAPMATLAALAAAQPVVATDPALAPGFFRRAARLERGHPESLEIDDLTRERAVVSVLRAAADWVHRGRPWPASESGSRDPGPEDLLGRPLDPRSLRAGIEAAHRRMASHTRDRAGRRALVDRANAERKWSLW